jgi:hypothetical protein
VPRKRRPIDALVEGVSSGVPMVPPSVRNGPRPVRSRAGNLAVVLERWVHRHERAFLSLFVAIVLLTTGAATAQAAADGQDAPQVSHG